MTGRMRSEGLMLVMLGMLATACGSAGLTQLPPPDQPVPASEPRAELSARVDLTPARDCEEAFDLAVYEQRAIELVAWDDRVGTCHDRAIDIRYLSRKISRDKVIQTVRSHAERVTVVPGKGSNDDTTK